jgi:hypothetical protein
MTPAPWKTPEPAAETVTPRKQGVIGWGDDFESQGLGITPGQEKPANDTPSLVEEDDQEEVL